MESVYLETTFISYLVARLSRDLLVAGHQQITREWFAGRARMYDLFISQLVAGEAAGGDMDAARERSAFLQDLPRLGVSDAVHDAAHLPA